MDGEEGAVEELELIGRVGGALTQAVDCGGSSHESMSRVSFFHNAHSPKTTRRCILQKKGNLHRKIHTILTQSDKPGHPPRQLRERIVRRIRLRPQRHVAAVAVELPYQCRVRGEGFRGGEADGVVGAPEAAGAAEGGEAGGGGEAGAEEGEHAGGG